MMMMPPDEYEDSYLEMAYEDQFRVEDDDYDWETRDEDFDDLKDDEW